MSWLSKGLKKVERGISHAIPHQHSADRRAANYAAKEQIALYKAQKEALEKEGKRIEEDRAVTKEKIARKQISAGRRAYRQPGFMEEASTGYGDSLGR